MNNDCKDKFENRIHFVAKHYKENRMDEEKAWKQFATSNQLSRTIPLRRYLFAAASIILAFVSISIFYLYERNTPEWVVIITKEKQIKDVYLPDSTIVSMAPNSRIEYDVKSFGKKRREVKMKGKNHFRVQRDESRPFSVYTEMLHVEVLGTTFQINEKSTDVDVYVASGKVKVTTNNDQREAVLTKGMSAHYSIETKEIEIQEEEKTNYFSWKMKKLQFNNTPLEEVIEDLSECYQAKVVSKTTIRGERLTSKFDDLPLEQVLQIINQTLDVRLVTLDNR